MPKIAGESAMMKRFKALLPVLALAGVVQAAPVHDFGCLVSSGENLDGAGRVQALGPVVESRSGPEATYRRALRPFFVYERDRRGREMLDILWPVGTISRWQGETTWRFLTAFGVDCDNEDPESRSRTWILPFFFWGRNAGGERYGAVFPLGGRIDGFLGRDVSFVLFPLYSHSRINDLDTHNVLWPLISKTTSTNLHQFRVFPFYGRSIKKNAWNKTFVLWPFWNSVQYDYPGARGRGYVLFPLLGHVKLEDQETWMLLPPFFRRTVGPAGREGCYPWPFIQTSSGKVDKFYLWPLYGRKIEGQAQRSFWLWPFVWQRHDVWKPNETDRFRVFPVFYTESSHRTEAPAQVTDRYVSIWPLVSYVRSGDDYKRVRLLDLWPFRDTAPIERNLAPWWTVYRYECRANGRESELLWGMVRWGNLCEGAHYGSVFPLASWSRDTKADAHREWDFLKGLVGYRRSEAGREYRLLYVIHWRDRP
jgi:hypothetical protein